MKTSEKPIIINHSYNVSKERLWEALTNPKQMRQWFFDNIPDFKPEVGFKTQFDVKAKTRTFPHIWKVTEVIPFEKINYSCHYKGYKGKSSTCFELSENENISVLKLTTIIHEDFSEGIPEFKRESCIEGWNYFIKQELDKYLNH